MAAKQLLGRLALGRTALFVCDVQERFRPLINGFPAVVETACRLVRAAAALDMPVFVTEQYPKALGATVEEIKAVLPPQTKIHPKTVFSMMVPEVVEGLKSSKVQSVLLVGIEAHVCILQTVLDLREAGYEVHLVVDGVSSQTLPDRSVAIQRILQVGGFLTTSESALFELLGDAKHPAFKTISNLAKERTHTLHAAHSTL